ncbi:glycosyltransferase [Lederbergia panacisoli]|uniref:glycosyltransferase family 2 protein n=1 Tax=Lederbergia panacisoli TaxID=1255251 RepID=UPI00214AD3B6|nr:glycosyltransferase [Lederbergia panacisoli]MCR2822011.1 glycosyltransferase [Lederbergia panacisoli]
MISIIVPIYNVEKYLSFCIESILNQTYIYFELILVNDGSPDKCGEICDEYAKKDKRIKVIHQNNGGLSSARNAGINIATGEYIAFVDSDDFIHNRMYELLYTNARKYKSDIVMCNLLKVNESEKNKIEAYNINIEAQIYTNIEALKQIYNRSEGINFVVATNKLFRRQLFNNLRFKIGRTHEDEFLVHRIFYESNRVTHIPVAMYYYRQRNNSIMGSPFSLKMLDEVYALKDRITFCRKLKLPELRHQTEFKYVVKLISYYFKVKKEYNNSYFELNKLKNDFSKSIHVLLFNPYFNKKEKTLWILFIIHPYLFELYVRKKSKYQING